MKTYKVTSACDVSSYDTFKIKAENDEQAIALAKEQGFNDDRVFEEAWDCGSTNERIVSIYNGERCVAESIDMDPDPLHDNAHALLEAAKELLAEVEHAIGQAGYDPDDRESIVRAREIIVKCEPKAPVAS